MRRPESTNEPSTENQPAAGFGSKLDKRMLAYVAAASAAVIGMASLAPAAEAKVVYTPANETIGTSTYLDLNHDGVADFKFITTHSSECVGLCTTTSWHHVRHGTAFNSQNGKLAVYGGPNEIWGSGKYASALRPKIGIGPWGKFPRNDDNVMVRANNINSSGFSAGRTGPWGPAYGTSTLKNRYLGLRFLINGQVHYGWARLNITINLNASITAVLTGYAYETVPNRPIITGETHGPLQASNHAVTPVPEQPAFKERTLGMLALGNVWLERLSNSASN